MTREEQEELLRNAAKRNGNGWWRVIAGASCTLNLAILVAYMNGAKNYVSRTDMEAYVAHESVTIVSALDKLDNNLNQVRNDQLSLIRSIYGDRGVAPRWSENKGGNQ